MATVIAMPMPGFSATTAQDIDNQTISNVSDQRLLQDHLEQRMPTWENVGEILDDDRSSDLLTRSHGEAWKVHQHVSQSSLPAFLEQHRETY
jgi:hypothetical protein